MKLLTKILSTFGGLGYSPIAPGTVASFGVILLYKFWLAALPWYGFWGIFIFLFLVGVTTSSRHARELDLEDPRCIVIDEAAGQFLVLHRLAPTWPLLIAAFLLFRLFDILKPFPIKKVEVFPSGWGIMLDDILAALYAGIVLNIYLFLK
jgi:phosphatidylglycerophosphatase A